MSESIYKNDELENEVSLDMSYFWYSDDAMMVWSFLVPWGTRVWMMQSLLLSLRPRNMSAIVMVVVERGTWSMLSRGCKNFRLAIWVDLRNWHCRAVICTVTGSELLSAAIETNLAKGWCGLWSDTVEPIRLDSFIVTILTSSILHLINIASVDMVCSPLE